MKTNDNEPEEWLIKAENDLGSAKLLLKKSSYFDIIIYHSHQCVEKILKWYLLIHNEKFPFSHDLIKLLTLCYKINDFANIERAIVKLHELLPNTRYPLGDHLTIEEAEFAVETAQKIYTMFTNKS